MFKNSSEIFAYIKKEDIKLVDVRFTDLPGIPVSYTHLTLPTNREV